MSCLVRLEDKMHNQPQINTLNTVNFAALRTIRVAFDDAVKEVQVRRGVDAWPLSDDTLAKIARQIVELAQHGERDATRLRKGALSSLHIC